ncbi:unnamed protein product [Effrenium voratum]|nr:unnamed protein product [Effrenium voratum]
MGSFRKKLFFRGPLFPPQWFFVGPVFLCSGEGVAAKSLSPNHSKNVRTTPQELASLGNRLAVFLGCQRNYTEEEPQISPAFLLFEYVTGFLVRKQQVTLIRRFAEEAYKGGSLVAQMIMGAGKTTCIAPMLTLLLGNDGRLVVNIVPRALLAQTRNVMRKMFGQILAKRVVTLEFTRMMGQDDPYDVQLVKQQLFDAQRDAAVVCTTPAAIKSMFLRHLELLQLNHLQNQTLQKYKAEMPKAIGAGCRSAHGRRDAVSQTRIKKRMEDVNKEIEGNRVMAGFIGDVLGMLRKNSCALIDEVDLVLHPLKSELNFPIGNFEMYDLGCERWNLAVHLLDALFLNDEGHAAAGTFFPELRNCPGKVGEDATACVCHLEERIPQIVLQGYEQLSLQKQPHLVLLSRPWYDNNLRRPLAEWLACWIVTRAEAEKFRESVDFKDVCDFLSMELSELLKSSVRSKVESKADGMIGKLLTLGREWLFSLVPHVLSKIDRVQYGLLTERELATPENEKAPSSRRLLAVPFVAKDKPSPAAEFAQPDVLIGFTVLAYRYEGLRLSDTTQMLHHLQMKSARAARRIAVQTIFMESGPWSSRPTCVLFERWKVDDIGPFSAGCTPEALPSHAIARPARTPENINRDLGAKRYAEKGGKSTAGGLEPLNWEVNLDDEWKKLPNSITEKLREAVARKETTIRFQGPARDAATNAQETMVQENVKSKKQRKIRQVESTAKRGEDLKLPELQALSSSEAREGIWAPGHWNRQRSGVQKDKKKEEEKKKPEEDKDVLDSREHVSVRLKRNPLKAMRRRRCLERFGTSQKGIRVSVKKTFLHFSFVDAPAPCKRTFSCPAQLEDVQAFEKSGDTMGSLGSSEMSDDSSQLRRQDCGRSSASQPSQEASESPVGSNVGPSNSRGKTKTEGDLPVCCVASSLLDPVFRYLGFWFCSILRVGLQQKSQLVLLAYGVWVKIRPQVLVHVSIYQHSILGLPYF